MAIREVYLPTTGVTLVNLGSPPEVEAEADRRVELSKQPSKTPWSEEEARVRLERALAKPRIRTSTYSDGGGG